MKDAESHDFQQVDVNSVPRSARVATLMRARSHEGFDGLESIESFFAAIRAAGTRQVLEGLPAYVTVDMDALDPAFAPGVGGLEPGGMSVRDVQLLLRGMGGLDLVGADVNEVSPPLDPTGNTAVVACNLMFELLCLLADRVRTTREDQECAG